MEAGLIFARQDGVLQLLRTFCRKLWEGSRGSYRVFIVAGLFTLLAGSARAQDPGVAGQCLGFVPLERIAAEIDLRRGDASCSRDFAESDGVLFLRMADATDPVIWGEAYWVSGGERVLRWRAQLSGPGFAAVGRLEVGPERTFGLPTIRLTQTSLPPPDIGSGRGAPVMPGPPISRTYVFDGQAYHPR